MTSLYSRLFRYKARLDREPLEDFLSEALVDILTRMEPANVIQFLSWAFLTARNKPDWSSIAQSKTEWATQVQVPGGIADIVLYVDSMPALVVENKTWSSFQDHSTDEEEASQVTTYCKWLRTHAEVNGLCSVLLITGTTDAPPGYHTEGDFAVESRGQVTWAGVGRWFEAVIATCDMSKAWHELAVDLVEFLKEKKLNSEVFTTADVSAATLMLPTMERWRSSFSLIWSSADEICKRFLKARVSELAFHTEGGMLWQYRYGSADRTPEKAYVGVALRFPDQSQWFADSELPEHPHFAVMLLSDAGALATSISLPQGWLQAEDGFVAARGVHSFSLAPDRRISELQSWAKSVMQGAEHILTHCQLS